MLCDAANVRLNAEIISDLKAIEFFAAATPGSYQKSC